MSRLDRTPCWPLLLRRWRSPRLIIILFLLELIVAIPALALFGIADPNLYRTKLWQDGADNGFNSAPSEILYAYANHRPIAVPLVWSQFVTSYNVVISVLALFLLLVKAVLFITGLFPPLAGFLLHAALTVLFAYSVHAQTAPDLSDPRRPQRGAPWYLTKSCAVMHNKAYLGYCQQAKGAFAVTVLLMVLLAVNTLAAAWSMVPTKEQRQAHATCLEAHPAGGDEETKGYASAGGTGWEMSRLPRMPDQLIKDPSSRSSTTWLRS